MSVARTDRVWAVVPTKAFALGKSRLGDVLTPAVRAAFARALFDHVVGTLKASSKITGILVVTHDEAVAERARELGLAWLSDPPEAALAAIVDHGLSEVEQHGATAAFVCMSDLPRMTVEEVEGVISALHEQPVVIVPDAHERGTNVLCVSPPRLFGTCFGSELSFQQHLERARTSGFAARVVRMPGLSFDVDGPDDLARLD